jgi:hypothetical protein
MTELTQEQREHLPIALFYSSLSTMVLVDFLLVAMTSEKEQEEEWALNGLRKFGEIKRRYKDNPDTQVCNKETVALLDRMVKFYFNNYEKANENA